MNRIVACTLAALFLIGTVPLASADDEIPVAGTGKRPFTLGVGGIYKDKPYKGYDNGDKWQAFPLVIYEGEHFFVRGTSLGWKFITTKPWEVGVLGEYWGDGYESSDADILEGMDDRDPSFALGGYVTWAPEKFGLKLEAASDVSGNSDGTQVKAMAFYRNRFDNWFYQATGGAVWNNSDYIDYYYGVKSNEANATIGRTAYEGDDQTFARVGLTFGYQRPESKWLFLFGGRYDFMGDEVDDSPITSDDKQFMGFLAIGYTFRK